MREEYILPDLDDNFFKDGLIASIKDYDKLMDSVPESERLPVDTFACDYLFLTDFLTEEMKDDFWLIARDFLKHEFANVDNYKHIVYLNADDGETWTDLVLHKHLLNLMFNSYKSGKSEYTKALFRYLYKVYYKKEYKQLKRFNRINADDVLALIVDENGKYSPLEMARLLTIARIYDIQIGASCDPLYTYLDKVKKEFSVPDYWDHKCYENYSERRDRAEEKLLEVFDNKDEIYKYERKTARFTKKALSGIGHCSDFIDLCDEDDIIGINGMTNTMEILQRMSPNKEYSKSEIALYNELNHAINAVVSCHNELHDDLNILLRGEAGTDFYEHFPAKFNPDEIIVSEKKDSPSDRPEERKVKKPSEEEYSQDALIAEIEELRRTKHQQETEIKQLRAELSGKTRLEEENRSLLRDFEYDRKELAALREHVYSLTEDEVDDTISLQVMKDHLNGLKIIIIGGHSSWVTKMRSNFPDWEYISPSPNGTIPASIVENADYVYFFTDTISHATYYRYVNAVRERNVSFGYIHGVNIENNIRTIYKDLKED